MISFNARRAPACTLVGSALRTFLVTCCQQRDWVHKVANVLGCLPKACQAGARKALAEIRDAPDRDHAQHAIEALVRDYGVKWPKAVVTACPRRWPMRCESSVGQAFSGTRGRLGPLAPP
jgi:Transposase, Mutator family